MSAGGARARIAATLRRPFQLDVDPFALGLFRVALGAYVLLFYVMLAPSWIFYYGAHGIAPQPLLALERLPIPPPILLFVRSDAAMWALYAINVTAAILLALGIRWRLAALWLWHMNIGLIYRNLFAANGEEQVMSLLLIFSLTLPLGASCTWRQLRRREDRRAMLTAETKVRVWSLTALQVHLMLVYLVSLPDKLADSSWRDGTAVYYAMMAPDYPRWPGLQLFAWGNAALSRAMTAFALAVELAVPFLIWFRRPRLACLLALMTLHVGMALLIEGVMMFNLAMLVGLVLFLPSRRVRVWFARRLGEEGR